jgi:hypothetical protein
MLIIVLLIFLIKMVLSEPNDVFLTHYWSFDNGQMRDQVGSADMSQGNLTSFTSDRLRNVNSALALNGGWAQVPPRIYFDTPEFSITVWVLPQQIGIQSRVIDFGNWRSSNVLFSLDSGSNQRPYFLLNVNEWQAISSTQVLTLNQWQHLAATFNGSTMSIYINGTLTASQNFSTSSPQSIHRQNCYVGKSNWGPPDCLDDYSYSILDDLRFYNKSLSKSEIDLLINSLGEWKMYA